MKKSTKVMCWMLLATVPLMVVGCGGDDGAAAEKPLSEIKAEAEKMDEADLRAAAEKYLKLIADKQTDLKQVAEELTTLSPADMLGEKAKPIKDKMAEIGKSVGALQERFGVYYNKLAEKGADLSGLELKP